MARVVRKVSNKAVKGQKKDRKGLVFSKKFWIIIASIVVVLTAAGITIGVIVANNNSSTTVEVGDYFGETQKYNDTDVKFKKMTYQGVVLHTNPDSELYQQNVFVFAASLSSFYPFTLIDTNNDNTDLKDTKHEQIFNALVELQYIIDEHNKTADEATYFNLYIVDTTVESGNSSDAIYTDKNFCDTSSDSFLGPLFSFHNVDGLQKTVPNSGKTLYSESYSEGNTMMTSISNAMVYVKSL